VKQIPTGHYFIVIIFVVVTAASSKVPFSASETENQMISHNLLADTEVAPTGAGLQSPTALHTFHSELKDIFWEKQTKN